MSNLDNPPQQEESPRPPPPAHLYASDSEMLHYEDPLTTPLPATMTLSPPTAAPVPDSRPPSLIKQLYIQYLRRQDAVTAPSSYPPPSPSSAPDGLVLFPPLSPPAPAYIPPTLKSRYSLDVHTGQSVDGGADEEENGDLDRRRRSRQYRHPCFFRRPTWLAALAACSVVLAAVLVLCSGYAGGSGVVDG